MSDKSDTISSVLAQIRNSGLSSVLKTDLSLPNLFVLRYLLDQPNDIVNLQKDIEDLPFFPERLNASYQDEWIVFCKKTVSKLGLKNLSGDGLAFLTDGRDDTKVPNMRGDENPSAEVLKKLKSRIMCMQNSAAFSKQLKQLCLIQTVLGSKDVAVLKSEQQRKLERFIKQ